MKANFNPKSDVSTIELAIVETVLTQSIEKMSEQEREDLFAEFGAQYTKGSGRIVMAALQQLEALEKMLGVAATLGSTRP